MFTTLIHFSFLAIVLLLLPFGGQAAENDSLPIPRFVSIKSSEANARTGPNIRYPIQWVFISKGEPVEILAEFEQWRKIRDKQGDIGWVHKTMLSGRRHITVVGDKLNVLYSAPNNTSSPLLRVEPEVRGELISCAKEWCQIEISDTKGWIEKQYLWGIYQNEESK